MPRDPSSTPCEKAIPKPHIQVSICSCIRSGYKSERPLPWTRLLIDNLPYRGAPRFPTRLITLAEDTFLGQCPTSEDQHVATLPRLSREFPAGLHPKHHGVWAHRPQHSRSLRAGRSRLRPLGRRRGHAAMLNWTSDKASTDTTTPRPITILAWWLVRKVQLRPNTQTC